MYINIHPIEGKVHCGEVYFPYGTKFGVDQDGFIYTWYDGVKRQICLETSERAYQDFAWNEDGRGEERKDLINSLKESMSRVTDKARQFEDFYTDFVCLKYKKHPEDMTEWSWDRAKIHKAPIEDLEHIGYLIRRMTKFVDLRSLV